MNILGGRPIFAWRRPLSADAPEPSLAGANRERGFALLLVLWSLSLLALLATQVTAAGRAELRLSSALTGRARLQEAADAGVYETIWHLIDGRDAWTADIGRARLAEDGTEVDVTVVDDRGKLDLNAVSGDLAASFFAVLGADRAAARDLADRITEWRTGQLPQDDTGRVRKIPPPTIPLQWGPPGHDLQRLEELRLIPGMTEGLYRAILPHAVLHLDQGPLYRIADAVVRAAMDQNRRESQTSQADPDPREGYVVHVVASATHGGLTFSRIAEIRIFGSLGNDAARFRVLGWN